MIGTRTEVLDRRSSGSLSWLAHPAARLLLANLILVFCAQIAVPLPWTPVPVTLQTFGVLLIAVLFGARASALAALLYLVEGAAGLPVFQPYGAPGAARLFGPTAGYLLAFPVAAFVAGHLAELHRAAAAVAGSARASAGRPILPWLAIFAALLAGEALIFAGGWAWLAALVGGAAAFAQGVLPFLAGECVKVAAVATISPLLSPRI